MFNPVDDLLTAALADFKRIRRLDREAAAKAPRKRVLAEPERPLEPSTLFTAAENWVQGRGIALVHGPTQTLLGTFVEWTHRTEAGCRKLVRATEPVAVSATELTDFLPGEGAEAPEAPQRWHEQRTVVLPLALERLAAATPVAELVVHLSYGSIARVTLATETLFVGMAGTEQLLVLAAGTNVLPAMTLDAKLAVRAALGKDEAV